MDQELSLEEHHKKQVKDLMKYAPKRQTGICL